MKDSKFGTFIGLFQATSWYATVTQPGQKKKTADIADTQCQSVTETATAAVGVTRSHTASNHQ